MSGLLSRLPYPQPSATATNACDSERGGSRRRRRMRQAQAPGQARGRGGGVACRHRGRVQADSAAPLAFTGRLLDWSLGNGDVIIAEVHHVAEAYNVTEISGLIFCAVQRGMLLRILQHIEKPHLELIWIPACCPVRREQQVWKVGVQPGGPWPRRLEAEIRIIGLEVVLVAIVELDFPGPILVLRFHYSGEPCAVITWFLGIFEEAFYPSPFSDLRSESNLIPVTARAIPLRNVWRRRSIFPALW